MQDTIFYPLVFVMLMDIPIALLAGFCIARYYSWVLLANLDIATQTGAHHPVKILWKLIALGTMALLSAQPIGVALKLVCTFIGGMLVTRLTLNVAALLFADTARRALMDRCQRY